MDLGGANLFAAAVQNQVQLRRAHAVRAQLGQELVQERLDGRRRPRRVVEHAFVDAVRVFDDVVVVEQLLVAQQVLLGAVVAQLILVCRKVGRN